MKRTALFILILAMLLSAFSLSAAAEEQQAGLQQDVVILFTSDSHCAVDKNWGFAGVAALRDYFAGKGHALLVDNGDEIQGEPVGTLTKGSAVTDILNAVKYDSLTIGNHEFDYGMERFTELAKRSKTPYISCNFTYKGEPVFEPYTIKEFDGVKIAFVGVTTPQTLTASNPLNFQDEDGNYVYGFCEGNDGKNLYDAVQKAVDGAREEGAEYVFLQAHLGIEANCSPWTSTDVIANTTGIDAVLDGHSHSVIDPSETLNVAGAEIGMGAVKNAEGRDVMLIACGEKLNYIGAVTISASDGSISGRLYPWSFEDSAAKVFALKNKTVSAVDNATKELNRKLSAVIAQSDAALVIRDPETKVRIVRNMETGLGDLCADAFRETSGADIAVVNGGGIRDNLPAGKVTLNDVMKVFPFGNTMCVIEASGSQIADYLEWTSRMVPAEFGAFAQVSGLSYEINSSIESSVEMDEYGMFAGVSGERRVSNIKIGGVDIEPDRLYTVAGTDFVLLNNGDGVTSFDGCKVICEGIMPDYEILRGYITDTLNGRISGSCCDTCGEGRIVITGE